MLFFLVCKLKSSVNRSFHAARVDENQTTSKAPITVRVMGMRKVDDLRSAGRERPGGFMGAIHYPIDKYVVIIFRSMVEKNCS